MHFFSKINSPASFFDDSEVKSGPVTGYTNGRVVFISLVPLEPGIDCAQLPREAMFVALHRKVDTMLPRTNWPRVEPNRSGSLSRGEGISACSFS
jgi:hypothetical protein